MNGRQRWGRRPRRCPDWCAGDHQCTARHGYAGGEHRSDPLAWRLRYGRLVATRTQAAAGAGHMEVRVIVRLAADERLAAEQAQYLAVGIDAAVRAVVGGGR